MRPEGRVDERDTLFARMERTPGSPAYEDYYARHPERRALDDRIRAMPPLLDERGEHYDPAVAAETARYFDEIGTIAVDVEVVRRGVAVWKDASDVTTAIRAFTRTLGAVAVGFARLDEAFVYTHKGRFDDDYGEKIHLDDTHAVVFLVEMDHERMQSAPRAPTLLESARQYYRAARIAKTIAAALEAGGATAKAHYDAHYDVLLVPLAVAAGLGELGRNNILVSARHGARVRIGAVTTTLELRPDAPISLGVDAFCRVCGKCADNCPSRALTTGPKVTIRGVEKWPTDAERCHAWWRHLGTDCGICMAVCPFSHRDNAFHALVRGVVRRLPFLNRVALFFDDLLYGRSWKSASSSMTARKSASDP